MTQDTRGERGAAPAQLRRKEMLAFLVLAFGIWPIVAVSVVGGYGFLVWMWQIVFGPPGPPATGLH
jgi:nitrate reductase NapE